MLNVQSIVRPHSCADFVAPFSAGSGRTPVEVPANACDCHVHVYDAAFPSVPNAILKPPDATVTQYRQLQLRTGTQRMVFVTPSTYGTNNGPMLNALQLVGAQARGVAVVDTSIGDAELHALHAAGVRGVRLNLSLGVTGSAEHILPLANRIAELGWHLQLLAAPAQLVAIGSVLKSLPVQLVLDHFGRVSPSQSGKDAHQLVIELLAQGRAWVKLSGAYIITEQGPPGFDDVVPLARSYLQAAPDRVVWGSDWPHASASAGQQPMPDDAKQMSQLAQWTETAGTLKRVLTDNPAELYGF